MNKANVKILVCCHKPDIWKEDEVYMPIQVGKAISNVDLGIQGDDTGDNISHKNKSYCELTGMYWAWKNLPKVDYIGLCHYRRYFNFNEKGTLFNDSTIIDSEKFNSLNLSLPNIEKIFKHHDIILTKPKVCAVNLFSDYSYHHFSEDARIIERIILTKHPDYNKAFEKRIYNSNKISHYNMFIMSWNEFDKYCNWIFPILKQAENEINIENYNDVQKRIWGYMAERLLLLYVNHNKLREKKIPVYFINDKARLLPLFIRMQRTIRMELAFAIMK